MMSIGNRSWFLSFAGQAVLGVCALLSSVGTGIAGQPAIAVVAVKATPNPASVSRSDVLFYVSYDVSIKNTSNSSVNYKLAAKTTVIETVPSGQTAPFNSSSGAGSCSTPVAPAPIDPTSVNCVNIDVDKGTTKVVTVTFQTPKAGDRIDLAWSVSFQSATPVTGTASAVLTTVPYAQSTTEFNTYVPTSGGTFFTGFSAGAGTPVGGVATSGARGDPSPGDPFTTTVVIPNIANPTTAAAQETSSASNPVGGCQNYYYTCFGTDLTIPGLVYPGTNSIKYITIFLRIDRSQISDTGKSLGINNVWIYYRHLSTDIFNPVPLCSSNATLPSAGQPCIQSTIIYGTDPSVPVDFQGDWQWEIRAIDNGRFIV